MSNLAKMTLAVDMAIKQKIERDTLTARVSELEAAAKLALDALKAAKWKSWRTDKAIDALEAVL